MGSGRHNILDERLAKRGSALACVLVLLSVAALGLGLTRPTDPLRLAPLLVLPPLTFVYLAWASTIFEEGASTRMLAVMGFVAPIAILFLQLPWAVGLDMPNWLAGIAFLSLGLAVLLFLLLIVLSLIRIRGWPLYAIGFALLLMVYASNTFTLLDTVPDRSAVETIPVVVTRLEVPGGRGIPRVEVSTPEGRSAGGPYLVSRARINRLTVGDTFCVRRHAGFLHIPWTVLTECAPPYRQIV